MRRGFCGRFVLAGALACVVAALLAPAGAVAQAGGFGDTHEHFAAAEIGELAGDGVFEGTLCGTENGAALFCPGEPLERWVMAVWMVRVLDGADPDPVQATLFSDLDVADSWVAHVERLAQLGVTQGYSDGTYRPDRGVTRAQMAAFFTRAFDLPQAESAGFADTAESVHHDAIDRLAATGVTRGCGDGTRYCPDRTTTRGEMAAFISRVRAWSNENAQVSKDDEAQVENDGDALQALSNPDVPPVDLTGTFKQISASRTHTCGIRTDGTIICWGNRAGIDAPGGTFKHVAAGSEYSCAIRTDDTLTCWSRYEFPASDPPAGTFKQVTSGDHNSCAIRTDDTLTCWGNTAKGMSDAPTGTFQQVATGGNHSCAIRTDGTVTCWGGSNLYGQADPPTGTFKAITADKWISCGIRGDDTVACWGATGGVGTPVGAVKQVSVSRDNACAIRSDDTVACWGTNQIGYPSEGTFREVQAGALHSCAIRDDDTLTCWGWDWLERLQTDATRYKEVAISGTFACAIRLDDTLSCWGWNHRGQAYPPAGTFKQVDVGNTYACGIRTDDTLACWGGHHAPPPDGTFKQITLYAWYACGIRTDDTLACWGQDHRDVVVHAPEAGTFKQVALDPWYGCAIRTDDTLTCWGNEGGVVDVPDGRFKQVAVGCAIRTDDTLVCWGDEITSFCAIRTEDGKRVCYETEEDRDRSITGSGFSGTWKPYPTRPRLPDGTFTQVERTSAFDPDGYCAIRTDGSITCWGDEPSWPGEDTGGRTDPPEGAFARFTSGDSDSCAIGGDGTVSCWTQPSVFYLPCPP